MRAELRSLLALLAFVCLSHDLTAVPERTISDQATPSDHASGRPNLPLSLPPGGLFLVNPTAGAPAPPDRVDVVPRLLIADTRSGAKVKEGASFDCEGGRGGGRLVRAG
jgi:hypothetical protein